MITCVLAQCVNSFNQKKISTFNWISWVFNLKLDNPKKNRIKSQKAIYKRKYSIPLDKTFLRDTNILLQHFLQQQKKKRKQNRKQNHLCFIFYYKTHKIIQNLLISRDKPIHAICKYPSLSIFPIRNDSNIHNFFLVFF